MKVLVTGANGYLGLGIVNQLLKDGCDVVATDIEIDKINASAKRFKCDLFAIDNPFEFFERPDIVLHLAWKDGFVHNSDSHIEELPNHHKFLLKLFQSSVKRIAIMGSMHEIGFYEGSIDENTPCRPMTLYGIAKHALRLDAEYMAVKYNKPLQWLRGYYIVGNTSYGSSIFSKIVRAVQAGQRLFPFTKGLNKCDFLDYDQFCLQTATAVEQDKITGIINICSGTPQRLSERVEKFIKDNNYDISLQYGAFAERPYDSKAIWGDNSKISQILQTK